MWQVVRHLHSVWQMWCFVGTSCVFERGAWRGGDVGNALVPQKADGVLSYVLRWSCFLVVVIWWCCFRDDVLLTDGGGV